MCGGRRIERYAYRNHRRARWKPAVLRDRVLELLARSLKLRTLTAKTLFSTVYDVARCTDCGYGQYDRVLDDALLAMYYERTYDEFVGRDREPGDLFLTDERSVGQWDFIRHSLHARPGMSVLEIGAGDAYLSLLIREHVPHATFDVVQPGDAWLPYYERLQLSRVAEFFPLPTAKRYDLLILSHTLEHIPDARRTFANLEAALAPGGLVFIEVPNCTLSYWENDVIDPPGHVHYFTDDALLRLARDGGLEAVRIACVGMTHADRETFWRARERCPATIVADADRSIRENIPNAQGEYLRGLFRGC